MYMPNVGSLSRLNDGATLSSREIKACANIGVHLYANPTQEVAKCPIVIDKVDVLFREWTNTTPASAATSSTATTPTAATIATTIVPVSSHPEDASYYDYLAALRSYYFIPQNKSRLNNVINHLKRLSLQCFFCRGQHKNASEVYENHIPELHILLRAIEKKTGVFLVGVDNSSVKKFNFGSNEEILEKRFTGCYSDSIVPVIVNSHLRSVYNIKKNGRFGEKVNIDFRDFLSNARKTAVCDICQFCGKHNLDLPGHMISTHLADVHAAIGGLDDTPPTSSKRSVLLTSVTRDDIMTGTTLIQNDLSYVGGKKVSSSSSSKAKTLLKDQSVPSTVAAGFACPKCEFTTALALDLASHYAGHFSTTFDTLSAKKKVVVKIKSTCPICKDKNVFMQYGQLVDHITARHPAPIEPVPPK